MTQKRSWAVLKNVIGAGNQGETVILTVIRLKTTSLDFPTFYVNFFKDPGLGNASSQKEKLLESVGLHGKYWNFGQWIVSGFNIREKNIRMADFLESLERTTGGPEKKKKSVKQKAHE